MREKRILTLLREDSLKYNIEFNYSSFHSIQMAAAIWPKVFNMILLKERTASELSFQKLIEIGELAGFTN